MGRAPSIAPHRASEVGRSQLSSLQILILLVVLALMPVSARAAVFYTDNADIPIPLNIDGVYLNLATGSTASLEPGSYNTAPWINPIFGGVFVGNGALANLAITGSDQLLNLSYGTMIDDSLAFTTGESGSSTHMGPAANQFQPNTPGYIGFQMKASPTADICYGWLQVTFNNTGSGVITRYAYQSTPNTAIATGFSIAAVPELSRALLLMLGIAGVTLRRKRAPATSPVAETMPAVNS